MVARSEKTPPVEDRFLIPWYPAIPEAPEPAAFGVAADAEGFVIRVKCWDKHPPTTDEANAGATRKIWRKDCVEILLSPWRKEAGNAIQIGVGPTGRHFVNIGGKEATIAGLSVKAALASPGWVAEVKIPFAGIGIAKDQLPAYWGLNIVRNRPARPGAGKQALCWSRVDREIYGILWLPGAELYPDLGNERAVREYAEKGEQLRRVWEEERLCYRPERKSDEAALTVLTARDCEKITPRSMLTKTLDAQRDAIYRRRDERLAAIGDEKSFRVFQDELRRHFAKTVGGFPPVKNALNPRVSLVAEDENIRVERVVYESRANFFVTGNLFLPKNRGGQSLPAILRIHGHSNRGRLGRREIDNDYQELAGLGYAVLTIDLPGQGERILAKNGNGLRSPTDNHYNEGVACQLTGSNLAGYMIWDIMRGLDYLNTREEIDPKRVVLTGESGGGTLTGYTFALDTRFFGAAPVSALDSMRGADGNYDAEQVLFDGFANFLDVQGYAAMAAPRPFCVITETTDAAQKVTEGDFAAIRRFYEMFHAADKLLYRPTREPHGFGSGHFRLFKQWLLDAMPPNPGFQAFSGRMKLSVRECMASKTGRMFYSPEFKGRETVQTLNTKTIHPVWGVPNSAAPEALEKWRSSLRSSLAETLRLATPETLAPIAVQTKGLSIFRGLRLEKMLLETERGVFIPAILLFKPSTNSARMPAVVWFADRGKRMLIEARWKSIEALAQAGTAVFLPDLRGFGETAADSDPSYRDGDEANVNGYACRLGTSSIGLRAADILACAHYLAARPDMLASRIGIFGDSLAAVNSADIRQWRQPTERGIETLTQAESVSPTAALFAFALDPKLAALYTTGGLSSYRALGKTLSFQHPYSIVVPGILNCADIPDLLAACSPRPAFTLPVDEFNRPLGAPPKDASPASFFEKSFYVP